jgi:hypothetical protein
VEIELSEQSELPQELLTVFAILALSLVLVNMLTLMIITSILSHIDADQNPESISDASESPLNHLHW